MAEAGLVLLGVLVAWALDAFMFRRWRREDVTRQGVIDIAQLSWEVLEVARGWTNTDRQAAVGFRGPARDAIADDVQRANVLLARVVVWKNFLKRTARTKVWVAADRAAQNLVTVVGLLEAIREIPATGHGPGGQVQAAIDQAEPTLAYVLANLAASRWRERTAGVAQTVRTAGGRLWPPWRRRGQQP